MQSLRIPVLLLSASAFAMALLPATSIAAEKFDGHWLTTQDCPAQGKMEELIRKIPTTIDGNTLKGDKGTADPARLRNHHRQDRRRRQRQTRRQRRTRQPRQRPRPFSRTKGEDYHYTVKAHFDGDKGTGTRDTGPRHRKAAPAISPSRNNPKAPRLRHPRQPLPHSSDNKRPLPATGYRLQAAPSAPRSHRCCSRPVVAFLRHPLAHRPIARRILRLPRRQPIHVAVCTSRRPPQSAPCRESPHRSAPCSRAAAISPAVTLFPLSRTLLAMRSSARNFGETSAASGFAFTASIHS